MRDSEGIRIAGLIQKDTLMQTAPDLLAPLHERYSPAHRMIGLSFTSPGYHTLVKTGTWVHPTISSLEYAVLLLRENDQRWWQRAADIFDRVLDLQDTDPCSASYGFWPYLLEEPIAAMSIPDRNWADFCGGRIAEALAEPAERLPEELRLRLRAALGHAAWTIFRGNIRPHYTNIAIMGGVICAIAGEMLDEPRLLIYGRRRLERVAQHKREADSFNEYNSPTYTMIALEECERALFLVRDPDTRALAEDLRQEAWRVIAEHFHPGTQQLAGPQSRTYTEQLSRSLAHDLSVRTGLYIPCIGGEPDGVWTGPLNTTIKPLPCPAQWVERFKRLPESPLEIRRRFIHRGQGKPDTIGTTWFADDACVGSISRDNMLYQRRPVLAYWNTGDGTVATLRLRFLHDGRDFSSAYVVNDQSDRRVLSAVHLLTNMGDYSLALDHPADGVFHASDFRLRYHLLAPGSSVRQTAAGRFELAAGNWKALIHTTAGSFDGGEIRWTCGQDSTGSFVDAICYQGPSRGFVPRLMGEVVLAVAMEIFRAGADADADASQPPVVEMMPGTAHHLCATWPGTPTLRVDAPTLAEPYLWA